MARIIEYDAVRVVALHGSAESHLAYSESLRSPAIGDLGTVVHLTPTWNPDDPATRFIVESNEGGTACVWLAEFAADELEFVHRPARTEHDLMRANNVVKRGSTDFSRDLLAYVAIALLVVAIIFALAWLTAGKGEEISFFLLNWICLGGVMAIVYATAIHKYRASWKNRRFWSAITLAMLLEIGIGILVLLSAPRISTMVWGLLVYPTNLVAVDQLLSRWLSRKAFRSNP